MINKDKEDQCEVFRKMRRLPNPTQRKLATQLGFSLGKVNYCLKALQKKGIEISDPDARKHVYGMPYEEWKKKFQKLSVSRIDADGSVFSVTNGHRFELIEKL